MATNLTTHLTRRDRVALVFRVVGAILGFILVIWAFATSRWSSRWVVGAFVFITVGGAIAYHLLTSIVRCPSCAGMVSNFRIVSADDKRKSFSCRRCGTHSWLAEGFYWLDDI